MLLVYEKWQNRSDLFCHKLPAAHPHGSAGNDTPCAPNNKSGADIKCKNVIMYDDFMYVISLLKGL